MIAGDMKASKGYRGSDTFMSEDLLIRISHGSDAFGNGANLGSIGARWVRFSTGRLFGSCELRGFGGFDRIFVFSQDFPDSEAIPSPFRFSMARRRVDRRGGGDLLTGLEIFGWDYW